MGAGASTEALPASLKADDAKAFLGDKFDEAKFAELAGESGEVAKEAFLAEVAKATPAEGVTEVSFSRSREFKRERVLVCKRAVRSLCTGTK